MTAEDGACVYIYGVIRDDRPLTVSAPPVSGAGVVYRIAHRGLAAVVSDGSLPRYELTRTNIRGHQAVLDCVMRTADVLPARLGATLPSAEEVVEDLLEERHAELVRLLDYVNGRVELNLKVSWIDLQHAFREVVAEDRGLRALRDRLATHDGAAGYDARIRLGDRAGQALAAKRTREADRLAATLAPYVVKERRNDPMSDLMILNAAFLVDRQRAVAFEEAVTGLDGVNQGRLSFLLAGPLPPYNFVTLHIVSKSQAHVGRG
jgi:hypothetical protein